MVKGRLSTGGGEYGWGARWPGPVSLLTTASFTRDGSPSRVRKPALWEHMPAYAPPKTWTPPRMNRRSPSATGAQASRNPSQPSPMPSDAFRRDRCLGDEGRERWSARLTSLTRISHTIALTRSCPRHHAIRCPVMHVMWSADVHPVHAPSSLEPPCGVCWLADSAASSEPAASQCDGSDAPEWSFRRSDSPALDCSSCFLLIVFTQSTSDNSASRPRIGVLCDIVNPFCGSDVVCPFDGSTQRKAPLHVYSGQLCQNYGASPMSVPTVC